MNPAEMAEQEMLNRLAAIQAATEILVDNDDLPANERRAFLTVIERETGRLLSLVRRAMPSSPMVLL